MLLGVWVLGVLRVDCLCGSRSSLSSGCTPKVHTRRHARHITSLGHARSRAVSVARPPAVSSVCAETAQGPHTD